MSEDIESLDGLEAGMESGDAPQINARNLPPRKQVKIRHKNGQEATVLASSLLVWESRGWTLVDDSK